MRKKVLLLTFLLACSGLEAQRFNGYIHSDFSGILGARVQPASIAGSPYKWDVSLINGNFYATNNIAQLQRDGETSTIQRFIDDKTKFLQGNASLGGISALITLPNNQAIGLQYQLRAHASANDLSPDFISQFNRFTDMRFLNSTVENQTGEVAAALWRELSLTYAKVIFDDGFSKWKVGATAKMVNTYGSVYAELEDLDYTINGVGIAQFTDWRARYGYSFNLEEFRGFNGNREFNGLPPKNAFQAAFDFGIVFERKAYRADPKTTVGTRLKPDVDYLYKVSVSLTDIGVMKFTQGLTSSRILSITTPPGTNVDFDGLLNAIDDFESASEVLGVIAEIQVNPGQYTMSMPTALNINVDYSFGKDFFLNGHALIDVTSLMPVDYRLNYLHSLTVTPRWEQNRKALYLPVQFNQIGDLHIGAAARLGILTIGTQNLGALVSSSRTNLGFFFNISINQLIANSDKPYCFGTGRGSGMTRTKRKPLYKRKKFLFF